VRDALWAAVGIDAHLAVGEVAVNLALSYKMPLRVVEAGDRAADVCLPAPCPMKTPVNNRHAKAIEAAGLLPITGPTSFPADHTLSAVRALSASPAYSGLLVVCLDWVDRWRDFLDLDEVRWLCCSKVMILSSNNYLVVCV
jgi:hypothetical protein